jgi:hypothetical protein
MPQNVKAKPKINTRKLGLGAAAGLGAAPYIQGVDTILQALASKDKDVRSTMLAYGLANVAGNAAQDPLTAMATGGNPLGTLALNTAIDSSWNLKGDEWFRNELENKDSLIWKLPQTQLLKLLSDTAGDYARPAAKATLDSDAYKATVGNALALLGLYAQHLNEAAKPVSKTINQAIDKGIGKTNTPRFAPSGGPTFDKNPYAK